jgi:hypothetical protein
MGDSTSRRASMTLYALLNSTTHSFPSNSTNHSTTHPTVDELDDKYESDINKEAAAAHSHTETCNIKKFQVGAYTPNICSPMPASGVGYLMVVHHISCTNQIQWMVKLHEEEKALAIDLLQPNLWIVSLGIWEIRFPERCNHHEKNSTLEERIHSTIDSLKSLQRTTNVTIVWRTGNYLPGDPNSTDAWTVRNMNQQVIQRIQMHRANDTRPVNHPRLTVVDWGGAIEPRSHGDSRINGDMQAHMGVKPRVTLIQMLTNHLFDVGYFSTRARTTVPLVT